MSILIEVIPDRPELYNEDSDSVSTPESDLVGQFQSAYQRRFLIYESRLKEVLNLLDLLSPELAPSHYPRVSVVFDDEAEEIVFDFSLYERLLETYAFEGWEGILLIEEALDKHLPLAAVDSPSGGTQVNKATLWLPVQAFFRFTRNLLALLIRESLIKIEQKAASVIFSALSASNLTAKEWEKDFKFKLGRVYSNVKATPVTKDLSLGGYVGRELFYCVGDEKRARALSNILFDALSEIVRLKFAYEETLERLSNIRASLHRPHYHEYEDRTISQLTRDESELMQLAQRSNTLLKSLIELVYSIHPLGSVVLDGLRVGFLREEMEHKLGMALAEILENIDELGQAVDPSLSHVAAKIPTPISGVQVSLSAIQRWTPPQTGIESCIASAAVEQLAGEHSWFPLAHEATWHHLVESGAIAKDSFEYVVYFHYSSALIDILEIKRQKEQDFEEFWKFFSGITMALSLASLATPKTAIFAPVLRGVSTVVDLAVMAYSIYSVTGNLARLNQSLAEELVHPKAFAMENLARIGELAQIRREILDEMTEQIAIEFVLTVTGARWALVKNGTLARGYYFDLEALLDDGEEA